MYVRLCCRKASGILPEVPPTYFYNFEPYRVPVTFNLSVGRGCGSFRVANHNSTSRHSTCLGNKMAACRWVCLHNKMAACRWVCLLTLWFTSGSLRAAKTNETSTILQDALLFIQTGIIVTIVTANRESYVNTMLARSTLDTFTHI